MEKSSSIRRGAEKLGAARLTFALDGLDVLGDGRNTGEDTASPSSKFSFLGLDAACFDSLSSLKRSSRPSVKSQVSTSFFSGAPECECAYHQNRRQISMKILCDFYSDHHRRQKDRPKRRRSSYRYSMLLFKSLFLSV